MKAVTEIVRDRGDCDVVIDFSSVDIITSSSLSALLKLHKLLTDCRHRLVFCSVAAATKGEVVRVNQSEDLPEVIIDTVKLAIRQEAKLSYLEKAENYLAHPAFWASYVPVGKMDMVRIKRNRYIKYGLLTISLFFVALIILVRRKPK